MEQLTSEEFIRQLVALEQRLLERVDVSAPVKNWILVGLVLTQLLLVLYVNWNKLMPSKQQQRGVVFDADKLARELSQLTRPLSSSSEIATAAAVSPPPSPERLSLATSGTAATAPAAGIMSPRAAAG